MSLLVRTRQPQLVKALDKIVFLLKQKLTVPSLTRDRIYAIGLNPHKKMKLFPISTLSLFFLRDIIAMASAFTFHLFWENLLAKNLI
jgi:hypothetical protein